LESKKESSPDWKSIFESDTNHRLPRPESQGSFILPLPHPPFAFLQGLHRGALE